MNQLLPARLLLSPEGEPAIEWVRGDGSRATEPFFEDTLRRLRRLPGAAARQLTMTPADALASVPPGVAPSAFIFHVSRCGSTLVTQMLAALPANLVISEAPIIDDVLRAPRAAPRITEAEQIEWLRGAVRALGQRTAAREHRLFIKLDCWHLLSLPLIRRAFPGVPLVFVFRHPVEVLVSLMRQTSLTLVRDVVTPAQLNLSPAARDALGREDYAAAVLGALFRAAWSHRAELVPVGYGQLPAFVVERMPGGRFTAGERAQLRAAAARDAKNPGQPFISDTAEKRRSADAAILAASARWAEGPYQPWQDAVDRA